MERRKFIKNALLATGALSFSGNDLFASTNKSGISRETPRFLRSIMWETAGIKGSVLDKCKAIKAAGFDGIEPSSHMDRNEVIEAMKQTGLIASSVCCSTHWKQPLSHPDKDVRKESIQNIAIALEDASIYQTDALLIVPGVVNEETTYDECWNRATEGIRELIPFAEKYKVKICIENVWNNFLLSPIEARHFIDQFDSPYVKFYFDCGNILVYGWPEQWIKILGDRIGRIHIKEFDKQLAESKGKWEGFNTKLTEGTVNWSNVMKEIRKHYQSNWLTTEQGPAGTPDELKDLRTRLDKIISL